MKNIDNEKRPDLKFVITELISSKKEGVYWDFKGSYSNKNDDLIHDIICLSNSLHDGDKFLIFGVTDEPECEIIGVDSDAKRKNLADITDTLTKSSFVDNQIPEISLEKLIIEEKTVDVLVIKDNPKHKPYYLTRKSGSVKPFNIYSRINNINIAKDNSLPTNDLEILWKNRFGLLKEPYARFLDLLKKPFSWNNEITIDLFHEGFCFNLNEPEYRIKTHNHETDNLMFGAYFLSPFHSLVNAELVFKGNPIKKFQYYIVDDYSSIIGKPRIEWIDRVDKNDKYYYYYYCLDEFDGIFHYFVSKGDLERKMDRNENYFLYFNNELERKEFDDELRINFSKFYNENIEGYITLLKLEENDFFPKHSLETISKYTSLLKEFFDDWRLNNPLYLDF